MELLRNENNSLLEKLLPDDFKEIDNKLIQFKKDLQNRFETIKTLDIKEFKIEMIKQGEYPRQFYFLIIAFYFDKLNHALAKMTKKKSKMFLNFLYFKIDCS